MIKFESATTVWTTLISFSYLFFLSFCRSLELKSTQRYVQMDFCNRWTEDKLRRFTFISLILIRVSSSLCRFVFTQSILRSRSAFMNANRHLLIEHRRSQTKYFRHFYLFRYIFCSLILINCDNFYFCAPQRSGKSKMKAKNSFEMHASNETMRRIYNFENC